MKKILFALMFIFAVQASFAQDLDQLMEKLSKVENAQIQNANKEMLQAALSSKDSKIPPFVSKMDSVVAVIAPNCPQEINDEIKIGINAAEQSNTYEALVSVKNEDNVVSILTTKNDGEDKNVYIYVQGGRSVVFVKLFGKFSIEDLQDIVKEQQKDDNG